MIRPSIGGLRRRLQQREHVRALRTLPDGAWHASAGLHRASTAIVRSASHRAPAASVRLLLPSGSRGAVFAGVRTAVEIAARLALRTGLPLRVLTFDEGPNRADRAALAALLVEELGAAAPVETASVWTSTSGAHDRDVWLATYWTTAHALDVAADGGFIDRSRVVYLIQDHEPSFFPASAEAATASATYRAGFRLLVNSSPLQRFLSTYEHVVVPDESVFRPALDVDRLEAAAVARGARPTSLTARIGFYGRPGKPRNAFGLGVAALRVAAHELEARGLSASFVSMGESHAPAQLSTATTLQPLGRLEWGRYFDELAATDVLLSLQMSPHPSHPPLDMVASGGIAVTNDVAGSRQGLHDRLVAVDADPSSLGRAVADAAERAHAGVPGTWSPHFVDALGHPLRSAVDRLAGTLA
ncbi:hypothetical protein P9139_06985 [Curtobacterium flaccumfaciens]|nr:hypothetical protein P9139_06985 [Curtobacterium flaccumfaciens]